MSKPLNLISYIESPEEHGRKSKEWSKTLAEIRAYSQHRRSNPISSMTQIVGILCKDGTAVIACDSRLTRFNPDGSTTFLKGLKTDRITFKDGRQCLIAFGGYIRPAEEAIKIIKRNAKGKHLTSKVQISRFIRDSIDVHKSAVLSSYSEKALRDNKPIPDTSEVFSENGKELFAMIFASPIGDRLHHRIPILCMVNSIENKVEWSRKYHSAGGTTADSAVRKFLDRFNYSDIGWEKALILAVKSIEIAKSIDNVRCGGNTKAWVFNPRLHYSARRRVRQSHVKITAKKAIGMEILGKMASRRKLLDITSEFRNKRLKKENDAIEREERLENAISEKSNKNNPLSAFVKNN